MMTKNPWTSKYEQYCLKVKLMPSTRLIWQWLVIYHKKIGGEPDLNSFNRWVAKHRGKPYHRDTLKKAWQELQDKGIIKVIKKYSWRVWHIYLRSIKEILGKNTPRKKSRSHDRARGFPAETPAKPLPVNIAAAANIYLCNDQGFNYQLGQAWTIEKASLKDLNAALDLYRERSLTSDIPNPEGWLISCIRGRWWEKNKEDLYYSRYGGNGPISLDQIVSYLRSGEVNYGVV